MGILRRPLLIGSILGCAIAIAGTATASPAPDAIAVTKAQAIARVTTMIARNNRKPQCTKVTVKAVAAAPLRGRPGSWRVRVRVSIPAYRTPQWVAWIVSKQRITATDPLSAELQSCPRGEP